VGYSYCGVRQKWRLSKPPGGGLLYGGGFAGPRELGVVSITVAPSLIYALQLLRRWPIVISSQLWKQSTEQYRGFMAFYFVLFDITKFDSMLGCYTFKLFIFS